MAGPVDGVWVHRRTRGTDGEPEGSCRRSLLPWLSLGVPETQSGEEKLPSGTPGPSQGLPTPGPSVPRRLHPTPPSRPARQAERTLRRGGRLRHPQTETGGVRGRSSRVHEDHGRVGGSPAGPTKARGWRSQEGTTSDSRRKPFLPRKTKDLPERKAQSDPSPRPLGTLTSREELD